MLLFLCNTSSWQFNGVSEDKQFSKRYSGDKRDEFVRKYI